MGSSSFLIAGTRSGCGKTTVTLGLMAALRARGETVLPFKCGPDFIDPSLHRLVTGRISRNLDPWMCGADWLRRSFFFRPAPVRVVEGVMGLFDGGRAASSEIAKILGLPVLLVLDVGSAAESVAAVLKGFETFDPELAPKAVLLNRVGSSRHLELVSDAIRRFCRTEIIGHLDRDLDFSVPGRHLGLMTGEEEPLSAAQIERLAATVARTVDLDRLLALTRCNTPPASREPDMPATPRRQGKPNAKKMAQKTRIGVGRDRAFSFCYEDNLDLLRAAGAELVFFSPVADRRLPDGLDGIYLPGGYPELYAEELAANGEMRRAIGDWCRSGRLLYAECGGLLYLGESLATAEGKTYPMAGVFPGRGQLQKKRAALGYREVRLRQNCPLGPAGTVLRGHEFHYSTLEGMAGVEPIYEIEGGGCTGFRRLATFASYVHLHFASNPASASALVEACRSRS